MFVKDGIEIQGSKFNVDLLLLQFQEDSVTIRYSPALDLSGYGMMKLKLGILF